MKNALSLTGRLVAPFLIASTLVGALVIHFVPAFPVISDFADYDAIGMALAAGHGYIAVSAQALIYPPLYPLMLGVLYALFGHAYAAVFYTQYLLLGGIAAVIFAMLVRYGRVRVATALLAAAAVMLWPYFMLYAYLVSNEVLYTCFFTAAVFLLFGALEKPSARHFMAVGAVMGLAALTRPVILLLPFWLIIGSFILSRLAWDAETWEKSKRYLLAGLCAYALVLAPWLLYTYAEFGRVVPIASNFANVWEKGNVSLAYLDTTPHARTGVADIVKAKLTNVYLFWDPGASGYQMQELVQKVPAARYAIVLYYLGFFCILALAALSLFISRSYFPWLLWAVIGYTWGVHTALFPFPRYTLPIIPFVIAAAAYGLDRCWTAFIARRTMRYTA